MVGTQHGRAGTTDIGNETVSERADDPFWKELLPSGAADLLAAVAAACRTIEEVACTTVAVREKGDRSPVTLADERAEDILIAALEEAWPDVPIIAEERAAREGLSAAPLGRFFLVDPLDGTKEFIRGGDDYTVNVALVVERQPVFGIVAAPRRGQIWIGRAGKGALTGRLGADGEIADARTIAVRAAANPLVLVASRSHRNRETDAYLAHYPGAETVAIGSSLKFCLVAEGRADLYPRLGPTMEWDTAAGDAVLRAAGGRVLDEGGAPFVYAKPGFRNGWFLAIGDPNLVPVPLAVARQGCGA